MSVRSQFSWSTADFDQTYYVPPEGRRVKLRVSAKGIKVLDRNWRLFISERGTIRARRVTGLSVRQQREVATGIKNGREMALLVYPRAAP